MNDFLPWAKRVKKMDDPLEARLVEILEQNGIAYTRPERNPKGKSTLDFYLPQYGLSIEVKAWSTERLHGQLVNSGMEKHGIMVLIGLPAVEAFGKLMGHQSSRSLEEISE